MTADQWKNPQDHPLFRASLVALIIAVLWTWGNSWYVMGGQWEGKSVGYMMAVYFVLTLPMFVVIVISYAVAFIFVPNFFRNKGGLSSWWFWVWVGWVGFIWGAIDSPSNWLAEPDAYTIPLFTTLYLLPIGYFWFTKQKGFES